MLLCVFNANANFWYAYGIRGRVWYTTISYIKLLFLQILCLEAQCTGSELVPASNSALYTAFWRVFSSCCTSELEPVHHTPHSLQGHLQLSSSAYYSWEEVGQLFLAGILVAWQWRLVFHIGLVAAEGHGCCLRNWGPWRSPQTILESLWRPGNLSSVQSNGQKPEYLWNARLSE